jgi:hypothetical protein
MKRRLVINRRLRSTLSSIARQIVLRNRARLRNMDA